MHSLAAALGEVAMANPISKRRVGAALPTTANTLTPMPMSRQFYAAASMFFYLEKIVRPKLEFGAFCGQQDVIDGEGKSARNLEPDHEISRVFSSWKS